MLTYAERTSRIAADAAEVPATFGLRGFRGDVFRVNPLTSYVNAAGTVVLHTDIWSRFGWSPSVQSTLAELRSPDESAARILNDGQTKSSGSCRSGHSLSSNACVTARAAKLASAVEIPVP